MGRRLITGDIHGCYRTLRSLLEKKIKITKEDNLYFVGDFIDRGPASREVLDYLIDLKLKNYKLISVRGNHEDMLLKAFYDENYMHAWYNNGAEQTLRSFDIPEEIRFDFEGIRQIPHHYIQFIGNLPFIYEEKDFILCHAGINFQAENPFNDIESMLWIRDFSYNPDIVNNRRLFHGHTPRPLVNLESELRNKNARVINLDAGCVYKHLPGCGNLLAYDIDSGEYYYHENIDF